MLLACEKRFVLSRGHQLLNLSRIREIDNDHPALAVGIAVDGFWMILQIGVDLGNGPADRCINRGCGLGGFHFADLLPGLDHRAGFRQIDEHDVAQRILRKMTDPYGGLRPVDPNPFIFLMVSQIGRNDMLLGVVKRRLRDDAHFGEEVGNLDSSRVG